MTVIIHSQKVLCPLLKTLRQPPDYLEEYRSEFGYLGPVLHAAVLKARTQPTTSPATPSACTANAAATATPAPPTIPAPIPRSISGPTAMVQTGLSMSFVFWFLGNIFLC
jgi:transcription initiation factor TFIID subunit 6